MDIVSSRNFKKQYKKLPAKIKKDFEERLRLFEINSFNPILNNHKLQGKLKNARSINITGDIRVIYEQVDNKTVVFLMIAKHSELYD
ncbi:MAG: type II toxin-antitoxin system mRNA interferase toxin, RelE/StbE family [Candidatus Omnitrophica bacterium]|nr:type II toxin-antitoxin system mRNA interferase toxin, RelE/StbE family [Candidatus Omnitrophota bacterium]